MKEAQLALALWKRNAYVLWFVILIASISWTSIMPFMPLFLKELGVASNVEFWSGLLAAVSSIGTLVMAPVWGALGDRFGRKLMMLRAGLFLAVFYGVLAMVRTPAELLALRVLVAILTGFVPMAVALVAVSTPRENVGLAIGIVQTAWPTGALIGPMVGGLIADRIGLRAAMWSSSISLAAVTILVLFTVREQFSPPPRQGTTMIQDLRIATANPLLVSIILITTILMCSVAAMDPVLVPHLQKMMGPGTPTWLAGLLYSLPGLSFILAAPWWSRRGESLGYARTISYGMAICAALYLAQAFANDLWTFAILRLGIGLGGAAISPGVAALLATRIPNDLRGRGYGLNQSASSLGAIIGPLFGGVIASFIGSAGVFLFVAMTYVGGYLWVTRVVSGRLDALANIDQVTKAR